MKLRLWTQNVLLSCQTTVNFLPDFCHNFHHPINKKREKNHLATAALRNWKKIWKGWKLKKISSGLLCGLVKEILVSFWDWKLTWYSLTSFLCFRHLTLRICLGNDLISVFRIHKQNYIFATGGKSLLFIIHETAS